MQNDDSMFNIVPMDIRNSTDMEEGFVKKKKMSHERSQMHAILTTQGIAIADGPRRTLARHNADWESVDHVAYG